MGSLHGLQIPHCIAHIDNWLGGVGVEAFHDGEEAGGVGFAGAVFHGEEGGMVKAEAGAEGVEGFALHGSAEEAPGNLGGGEGVEVVRGDEEGLGGDVAVPVLAAIAGLEEVHEGGVVEGVGGARGVVVFVVSID